MKRLNRQTVLAARADQPSYDRRAVTAGIVHLGLGNFHRAHQAIYVDDSLAKDPSWGIVGVSLRRPNMADELGPQDGLYTLGVQDGAGMRPRIVGSVLEARHYGSATEALVARMAEPAIRLVTLTVTEKGYYRDPASGDLDGDHPDIRADLATSAPRTAPGLILAALLRRRAAGLAPFTVLSCDNLPENGQALRRVVSQIAALRSEADAAWIEGSVAFPSCMVDRIVPHTTDADRATVASVTGLDDAWPVMTEPFSQWVIEDTFPGGRPTLPGAEFVSDVAPYEAMKLRMLNGAHSTLAYLGQLIGAETVAEAVALPEIRAVIRGLWQEVRPSLDVATDLDGYGDALIARFANPALRHRTAQIAMDGSQKLPQRLISTIRDCRAAGHAHPCATLGVAAWIDYATCGRFSPDDPMSSRFPVGSRDRVEGMLDLRDVFGELGQEQAFRSEMSAAVAALSASPTAAIQSLTAQIGS
ncbi:MAG: mannitol dehydrogenase family protein [Pseudomonadota bacterium]